MRRRTLPPPMPGSRPVPMRPPDALLEQRNRRRRSVVWIAAACGIAGTVSVGYGLVGLNDGRSPIPTLPLTTDSGVEPTTPDTHSSAASVTAPAADDDDDALGSTGGSEVGTAALQPEPEPEPVTAPAPPPTVDAVAPPTSAAAVVATSAASAAPTTPPSLPASPGDAPTQIAPLAGDLRLIVAGADHVVVESADGTVPVLDVAASVAFRVGAGDYVFQRRRGRPQSGRTWKVSTTNIERRRGRSGAVLVVANDYGYLTLRTVSVASGAINVTYQIDRPEFADTDGELRTLNLLRGVTVKAGQASLRTPPQAPAPDVLAAFGLSAADAAQVSDIASANGLYLLNRVKDPGAPLPALIVDTRSGRPVVSELTTPGRATLPVG